MGKRQVLVGHFLVGAVLCAVGPPARAESPPPNLGKKIAPFMLADPRDQARFSLADYRDRKAIVIVFLGTECPINNAYLPRLTELHKQYAGQGVQFFGINANCTDSAQSVAEHARANKVPFPVLKDDKNLVADQLGARRTPEAFLLDGNGVLRYQGRIDDQHGIGYQRSKPARRDLAQALDEVLAGKEVSQPTAPVAGCLIARVKPPKDDGAVTYSKHVAPILQKHCQECHRPGQIGPMSLLGYEDARGWSAMMHEVVEEKRMPPWNADPRFGKFRNDRRLPPEDLQTILKWIELGCPKGDEKDLPKPREFADGWRIGKPDLVATMPEAFDVPAESARGIPYKHFIVDPGFKEDLWVVKAEAKAGAPSVVHHIVVFILPAGKRFLKDDPTNMVLAGTAPGDMPMQLADGEAKRIPAGARLVLQMHYTPNGKAQTDKSSIGIIFAKEPPKYEVRTIPVLNPLLRIPAGAENHQVEASYPIDAEARVIDFMPHMHLRGKDFLVEAIYPEGKSETLLSVPRFNFNWQSLYYLAEPLTLPKGTRLHCVAHFDNSAKNPNNPDPTRTVFWGDQTWQEMMIGWIDLAYERE